MKVRYPPLFLLGVTSLLPLFMSNFVVENFRTNVPPGLWTGTMLKDNIWNHFEIYIWNQARRMIYLDKLSFRRYSSNLVPKPSFFFICKVVRKMSSYWFDFHLVNIFPILALVWTQYLIPIEYRKLTHQLNYLTYDFITIFVNLISPVLLISVVFFRFFCILQFLDILLSWKRTTRILDFSQRWAR